MDEILKFYGIEDSDISQIKLDYNVVDYFDLAAGASDDVKNLWNEQRELYRIQKLWQIKLAHTLANGITNNLGNKNRKLAA